MYGKRRVYSRAIEKLALEIHDIELDRSIRRINNIRYRREQRCKEEHFDGNMG